MKQINEKLHFKKTAITELNDEKLYGINGGTSAVYSTSYTVIVNTFTSMTNSRTTGPLCDGVKTTLKR